MPGLSFAGMLNRALNFDAQLKEIDSDRVFLLNPTYVPTCNTLLARAIPVSRFFMYQSRRNPNLGAGSP